MNTFQSGTPTAPGRLRYSQFTTTGVEPDLMVAPVTRTGARLPAFLSLAKNETPLAMRPADPPSARLAIITPFSAALAWVGSPFSATAPLNLGPSRSFSEV